MSLDVYLLNDEPIKRERTGIFIRENGQSRELTIDEVKNQFPDNNVELFQYDTQVVFTSNITHNLGQMAKNAYLYYPLWRPDEKGWKQAKDIVKYLEKGLAKLKLNPEKFKEFNPENGWGSYENLVSFVEDYIKACKEYPDARIEVSR